MKILSDLFLVFFKIGLFTFGGGYAMLAFIEDALEISNNIEIFGGDSAKESCELYKDALRDGVLLERVLDQKP